MPLADLNWPPSPEHLAFHEAGHAVLMEAFSLGIQYIAIEPDSSSLPSWTDTIKTVAAAGYRHTIISGTGSTTVKPSENELADDISILVAGEIAASRWALINDDIPSLVRAWTPELHDTLAQQDPRHLESYQACKVATSYMDGDLEWARQFVVGQADRAQREVDAYWPAVRALALALLDDYAQRRAQERSMAPVQGALLAPTPARIIRDALQQAAGTQGAGE